jgi:hypothetical protein
MSDDENLPAGVIDSRPAVEGMLLVTATKNTLEHGDQ